MNTLSNRPAFWTTFFNCALAGPLFGGLPYNVVIVTIPFSYVMGGVPSLIGAALFVLWLRAGPVPGTWHSAAYGGLFGAIGCVLTSMIFGIWIGTRFERQSDWLDATMSALPVLLPHGILGGAVVAGIVAHRWHQRRGLPSKPTTARV